MRYEPGHTSIGLPFTSFKYQALQAAPVQPLHSDRERSLFSTALMEVSTRMSGFSLRSAAIWSPLSPSAPSHRSMRAMEGSPFRMNSHQPHRLPVRGKRGLAADRLR